MRMRPTMMKHAVPRADEASPRAYKRSGATLLIVLVWLMLMGALLLVITRQLFMARGAGRQMVLAEQARIAAESGLERAIYRLSREPDYQGETWAWPAIEGGDSSPTSVRIEALAISDTPSHQVRITAQVVHDEAHSAQYTLETTTRIAMNQGAN
jgi:hypothetical protein